ncbi:MAG TPA: Gldg family protein, partial [Anaerolineae bacterium]
VVYGFQSVDAVLAAMTEPVRLTLIVTPNTLPEQLQSAPDTIQKVAQAIATESNGKFALEVIDPDAPDTKITRQALVETYKLQPIPVSFFSSDTYYMDMLLSIGDQTQVLAPPADYNEAAIRTAIESGLKRGSSGFLKVVGLWTPPSVPIPDDFGQLMQPVQSWQLIQQKLGENYNVHAVDLSSGQVPPEVNVLLIVAPQNMTDKERFAIDQYLMRGGALIVAGGNYAVAPNPLTGSIGLRPLQNGLNEMLAHYGVQVGQSLVMDPQNEPFPTQVTRNVGGFQVQELQAINFPFFPDIRPDAMDSQSPIVSRLPAVTMNFVSPVELDTQKNAGRGTSVLLKSSAQSWLRTTADIQPDFQAYPDSGFAVEGERKPYPLAVSVQGVFQSFFKDKPSPFQSETSSLDTSASQPGSPTPTPAPLQPLGVIEESPETARLVVIGSSEFLDDAVLQLSSNLSQDRFLNSLQFVQNAVDWSVEDLDLLDIRSRGTITRVLNPMDDREESLWEALNYGVALVALVGIGLIWRARRRSEQPMLLVRKPDSQVEEHL